jgi:hypothetical protein
MIFHRQRSPPVRSAEGLQNPDEGALSLIWHIAHDYLLDG